MTTHTLKPSYIQLNYHSEFGAHEMTLPTTQWAAFSPTNDTGSFTAWDTSVVDTEIMVTDLVDALVTQFRPSVSFDSYTVWNFDDPSEQFIPVAALAFTGKVGTDSTTAWYEAVQSVFTAFDTAFNTVKLVLLDMNSRNNFARRSFATAGLDELALFAEWSRSDRAWASRAGFRPSVLRSISLGINDALKKQYSGI